MIDWNQLPRLQAGVICPVELPVGSGWCWDPLG